MKRNTCRVGFYMMIPIILRTMCNDEYHHNKAENNQNSQFNNTTHFLNLNRYVVVGQ